MRLRTRTLLVSAALLLAGASIASAQGLQMGGGGGERGGMRAQASGQSNARAQARGGGNEMRASSRAQVQTRASTPRVSRSEGVRSRAAVRGEARAQQRASQRSVSRQSETRAKSRAAVRSERNERRNVLRSEVRQRATAPQTLRQQRAAARAAQSDRKAKIEQRARDRADTAARSRAASDTRVRDRSTTGQGSANVNARARDNNEASRAQIRTSRTTITTAQQTRLREAVVRGRNVPRLNRVNFALRAGVIVPRNVRFVSVAAFPVLFDVFPAYRPYSFFVVEDDIVFVDRGYHIVDVVPLQGAGIYAAGGPDDAIAMDVDLTHDEIIYVQRVLVAQGFAVRVDGVWGPTTRRALVTFQQRRGLPAVGVIDRRTVTALGLTGKISDSRIRADSRTSTSTQDDASRPRANDQRQDRATTGRGGNDEPRARQDEQPRAGQGAQPRADRDVQPRSQAGERNNAAERSTTGQGGERMNRREPDRPNQNR